MANEGKALTQHDCLVIGQANVEGHSPGELDIEKMLETIAYLRELAFKMAKDVHDKQRSHIGEFELCRAWPCQEANRANQ